jgi:ABC-type amino acid transport substrate-binding protein
LLEDGVLTVSVYANFYPVAFKGAGGKSIRGFDVDVRKLFCKAAGLKLRLKERAHFDGIWFDPKNNKSDCSIGGIGMTPARLDENTEWSMPYFHVMRTIVYNKKTPH